MRWGDVVICSLTGDFGKPRPAIVVQSNLFNNTHTSIVVCPITSHIIDAPLFRILLEPHSRNGLLKASQIMVDKLSAIKKEKILQKIGCLAAHEKQKLIEALTLWLELGS